MKILILSANTGGGHNSTALAIGEAVAKRGISYEIADTLAFISKKASDFISWGHSYVYRKLPHLFGIGYRYEERHSARFLYKQCAKGADALSESLRDGHFDAVVCTHVFSGLMMTEVRRKYQVSLPTYFIATDYTCSPGVSEMHLDGYFIPHRMLRAEFIRCGVPADRLHACGIPVRAEFYETDDRVLIRRALKLPVNKKILLLACGSMGCGRLEKHALRLCGQLPEDTALVVLCGTNGQLYQRLLPHASERFRVLRFTERVEMYMAAADAYVTKPGGLTTTEAIAKRLPMLLVDAVPGLETRNFDFLIGRGVACGTKRWSEIPELADRLLWDEGLRQAQIKAMASFGGQTAAQDVCARLLGE